MKSIVVDRETSFTPWSPTEGKVFRSTFAFLSKGTSVDESRLWAPATFVIGAAYDGRQGRLVTRENDSAFFEIHEGVAFVVHDAAMDLDTINLAIPDLDIYRWVEGDLVESTRILHRLLTLATEGHTDPDPRRLTLLDCVRKHLGLVLPENRRDSRGRLVDRSYGRWLNKPIADVEPVYLESMIAEAIALYRLHHRLRSLIHHHLANHAAEPWGYVSPGWLDEQIRRWGLLTHHIQLRSAIVLRAISARGLHLDLAHRAGLMTGLQTTIEEQRSALRDLGYLTGQPSSRSALRSILTRIERRSGGEMPRTASGEYATSEEALAPLGATEPFVRAFLSHRAAEQLQTAFLGKMGRRVLHPSFDELKTTGRTSSYGELNAQNLPRDPRVRACFTARPGSLLVSVDFKAIELVALGQACSSQFGLESAMAAAINAGKDPHAMVAALATGKAESEITREERQKAKPVNFGLPGAMGSRGLQDYARASYDVELDDQEVEELSEAWFDLFPEMREFLRNETDMGLAVAKMFGLTSASYCEHTASRRFHDHLDTPEQQHSPSAILGGMCLKALKVSDPTKRAGRPYEAIEIDYFWSRIRAHAGLLPPGPRDAASARRPSVKLQRAVMALVDASPVFTFTGRLRAGASFPARHNTIFQGLASDGAKLALWKVWRAGHALINFIHDELVTEVPEGLDAGCEARELCRLMIEGMQEVTPNVRVEVECVVSRSWNKEDGEKITLSSHRDSTGEGDSGNPAFPHDEHDPKATSTTSLQPTIHHMSTRPTKNSPTGATP